MKKFILICISVILLIAACKKDNMEPLKTVDYVDLERFMGDWYVIAIIPNFIEKNAVNGIESYRTLNKDGVKIDYRFRIKSPEGRLKHLQPKAWIYDRETNAEWRVQFLWPFKAAYLIIDLAEDYSYTVVGEPSRKFVWIMARNPELDDDVYNSILERLDHQGYDIAKIKKMPQIWE